MHRAGLSARQAGRTVHADRGAAAGADPLGPLLDNKSPHADRGNPAQVGDRAHPVLGAITLVQVPEPRTGEIRAAEAEPPVPRRASPDPAARPRLGFARILDKATGAGMPRAQRCAANPAVDAARCEQDRSCGRASGPMRGPEHARQRIRLSGNVGGFKIRIRSRAEQSIREVRSAFRHQGHGRHRTPAGGGGRPPSGGYCPLSSDRRPPIQNGFAYTIANATIISAIASQASSPAFSRRR